ncbi:transcription factor 25 isoform X2 [Manduca sexta]|uniref:transcription factor 25 isoform X2 n=1 Tax=Manduca sexta TaxID=7130 RepID=UPI00188FA316|nr:transcription factor 25 isoform X2 [Manduca sexta]
MSNRHMRRALERLQLQYPMPNPDLEPLELEEVPELALPDINPYQELAAILDYENEERSTPSDPEFDFDQELVTSPEPDHESDSESRAADDIGPNPDSEPAGVPQPGHSGEQVAEPQPGPSGELIAEPKPAPSVEPVAEPQPGPSGELVAEPQPGPSGELVAEPQPGPSGELVAEPQPGPSGELVIEPQPGPSGVLAAEPQPGSSGEPDAKSESGLEADRPIEPKPGPSNYKPSRRSRRRANRRQRLLDELEEIERNCEERRAAASKEDDEVNEEVADALLTIKSHIMRVTPEMRRLFGSDVPVDKRRKKTPRERILRKSIIIEYPEDLLRPYNHSLTMSSCKGPNNTVIFMFDHTPEHQKLHREFLDMVRMGGSKLLLNLDAAQENIHVESMIEIFDAMCRDDNFGGAHHLIQVIVAMLQYATKPSFNLADRQCRLPYRYIENRPFHIAMLKYMYLLSNKARHRTALEMCKMMFNLDPTDPLALLFVIDTFALRAREFRWLVDVLEFWSYDRNANLMFNMLFSHSLAFFHLVKKSEDETDQRFAGELLQNAIIRFPYVITAIMSNIDSPAFRELKESEFYGQFARSSTSASMIKLMDIYARLTWPRWYEPVVVGWFLHNARVMAEQYIVDPEIQSSAHFYATYRARMFVGLPEEVLRHFCIVSPISNWVLDGIEVPVVSSFDGFDPLPPPDEIDRYGYKTRPASPVPMPTDWVDWLEDGEVLNIDFDDIDVGSYDYTYTQTVVVRHRHKGRGMANRGPFPSGSTADEGRKGNGRNLTRRLNEIPRARHFQNHFR